MLRYHQYRARLGMGDLHPGGAGASARVLEWLAERGVRRVLEVGAGIGNTAVRMASLGWQVIALEPDPVSFAMLQERLGSRARCEGFLAHTAAEPYDAILAESVLFQMSPPALLTHAHALLRPGGYLAFIEAVWSASITAEASRALHDETERLFGIAVGARERSTWLQWSERLSSAGFISERLEK